jgi:hypothetical protein
MTKTVACALLVVVACKGDSTKSQKVSGEAKVVVKSDNKAEPKTDPAVATKPETSEPKPVGRHKGIAPLPMPAAITLTAAEQQIVRTATDKATAGVMQSGVVRGGFPDDLHAQLRANPKLIAAVAQSSRREAVVAAIQALIDDQVMGTPQITLAPEWKPIIFAAMTNKDTAIAASATQSAGGGWRDEKADPDIQKLLQRQCADETRPSVRAAACAGVIYHLNTTFDKHKDAVETIALALSDEDNLVVLRTLDELAAEPFDAQHIDKLLALTKSTEPAIRGLAVGDLLRAVIHEHNIDRAALTKAHDALVAALKDPEPYVRCKAISALSDWDFKDRWEYVDGALPLLDDTKKPDAELKYTAESLEGPKPDTWSVRGNTATVGACATRAFLAKSTNGPEKPLKYDDWDHVTEKGRPAFLAWWKANGASLKATPKKAP